MDFVIPHCPESGVKIHRCLRIIDCASNLLIPLFDVVGKFNEAEFGTNRIRCQ